MATNLLITPRQLLHPELLSIEEITWILSEVFLKITFHSSQIPKKNSPKKARRAADSTSGKKPSPGAVPQARLTLGAEETEE